MKKSITSQIAIYMIIVSLAPIIIGTLYMNYALEDRFYQNRLKVLELLHAQAIGRISEKIDAHLTTIENSTQIPLIAKELRKATEYNSTTIEIDPLIAEHIKKIVIKHDIYDLFLITKEGQSGYSKEELIGKTHSILRDPAMPKELFEELWRTIRSGRDWSGEICNITKTKEKYWVKAHISPVYDEEKNIVSYTAIREDITDKKIIEELAITDRLTQVYNRIQLDRVLQSEVAKSNRYKTPFSVILDIDKFKSVNDTYGHQVGDSVLKESAALLKANIRESDTLGRWGGEEFLIIAPNSDTDSACALAQKLRAAMEDFCFTTVGQKTGSFGVSTYKEGDDEESVLKRADDALYKAKEGGRNRVETESS